MEEIRTFNRYNFVTGAVDGTLAYDFGTPAVQEPVPEKRSRRRKTTEQTEWIREDEQAAPRQEEQRKTLRVNPMGILCGMAGLVAAVLLLMMLLAQIRLISISNESVAMEATIEQLQTENDRLTVEYESVFNLKDVEDYAINVLGMQEPREDQIYYLTNVSSADKSVVVTDEDEGVFAAGVQDIVSSINNFVGKIFHSNNND